MSKQFTTIPVIQNQDDKMLKMAAHCRANTAHAQYTPSLKSHIAYYMQKSAITRIGILPVFTLNGNLAQGQITEGKFSD